MEPRVKGNGLPSDHCPPAYVVDVADESLCQLKVVNNVAHTRRINPSEGLTRDQKYWSLPLLKSDENKKTQLERIA